MTDKAKSLIAGEYRNVHAALAGLDEPTWATQSLCEAWNIRHVVAHMTMPARLTDEAFGQELAASQYDFTAMSNRIAARDSELPTAQLLDDLASEALADFVFPGGGPLGTLSHAVIHGLDATVPLGLGSAASPDALQLVLDMLASGGVHREFGADIDGRRLVATDLEWSFGTGAPDAAPAHVLVLRMAGRAVPAVS